MKAPTRHPKYENLCVEVRCPSDYLFLHYCTLFSEKKRNFHGGRRFGNVVVLLKHAAMKVLIDLLALSAIMSHRTLQISPRKWGSKISVPEEFMLKVIVHVAYVLMDHGTDRLVDVI